MSPLDTMLFLHTTAKDHLEKSKVVRRYRRRSSANHCLAPHGRREQLAQIKYNRLRPWTAMLTVHPKTNASPRVMQV